MAVPTLLKRQEPTHAADDELERTWCDAVPCSGVDPSAAHRAEVRAMNAARQADEARADAKREAAQRVIATRRAREQGPQLPHRNWPAVRRAARTGEEGT
jgi:hypothetical protein